MENDQIIDVNGWTGPCPHCIATKSSAGPSAAPPPLPDLACQAAFPAASGATPCLLNLAHTSTAIIPSNSTATPADQPRCSLGPSKRDRPNPEPAVPLFLPPRCVHSGSPTSPPLCDASAPATTCRLPRRERTSTDPGDPREPPEATASAHIRRVRRVRLVRRSCQPRLLCFAAVGQLLLPEEASACVTRTARTSSVPFPAVAHALHGVAGAVAAALTWAPSHSTHRGLGAAAEHDAVAGAARVLPRLAHVVAADHRNAHRALEHRQRHVSRANGCRCTGPVPLKSAVEQSHVPR